MHVFSLHNSYFFVEDAGKAWADVAWRGMRHDVVLALPCAL